MFTERVNEILKLLGASSAQIARLAGCDTSNISRLSSGARVPKAGGRTARRLVEGLYRYADENGSVFSLAALIGCENASTGEELKAGLMNWLFDGAPEADRRQDTSSNHVPFRPFGEKLNAVLELSELSNVRFGRLINMDPSYVSRFRSGLRSPGANTKAAHNICNVLVNRLRDQNRLDALAQLMGTAPADPEENGVEEWIQCFRSWLFGVEREDYSGVAEKLMENIDSFSAEPRQALLTEKELLALPIEEAPVYFGTCGLQNAVFRFLSEALRREESGGELLLYSDQSMDWLVEDPAFRLKWASLMMACVAKGIRIRIIHNLDRNPAEMIDAILSWLPLYLSGGIESFYCTRQKDSRFSHTLFLAPGSACIEAFHVAGQEEHGRYRYDTEPALLNCARITFDALLAESKRLVWIYRNAEEELPFGEQGDLTVIGTVLSLATMPEGTLRAMLSRSDAAPEAKKAAFALWHSRSRMLQNRLENSTVYEFLPLAGDEQLYAGEVWNDLAGIPLAYTPAEYADHIRQLLTLVENAPNYQFCPLPEPSFPHIRIAIARDAVKVTRLSDPRITFMISHPAIRDAFLAYAEQLREHCRTDRLDLRRRLENYLLV